MIGPAVWSTGSMNVSSGWEAMLPFPAETLALWDDVSASNSNASVVSF